MKYERLMLPDTATDQFIDGVIHALGQVKGIQTATRAPDSAEVTVQFDENLTSPGAMRATLSLAGYDIDTPKTAPSKSGCCGACGG
jgi:hypothetical protein